MALGCTLFLAIAVTFNEPQDYFKSMFGHLVNYFIAKYDNAFACRRGGAT